jgi:sugar-specific transcriptional regulator TrmB
MIDLSAAGLSPTEAKCYKALLEIHDCKPAELARIVNETRTNCYKVLDSLVRHKLAERFEKGKIYYYRATNPVQLLELSRQRRAALDKAETELQAQVKNLQQEYTTKHEQPGVRYYSGQEGIRELYSDQVKDKAPISFINTVAGIDFYSYQNMHDLRMLAVNAGIPRSALTPDTALAHSTYQETDKKFLLHRTWLQEDDYTAPVEWGVYGNKIYIVSFGTEAMGISIESQQIAEGFRQIFALLERGQRSQPWYSELPRLARNHRQSHTS